MDIFDSTRRTIRRYGLLPAGSRVAVALSGGADSVGLLLVLREIAGDDFHVAGAIHLNHQLRGAEADGDEAFCRDLCARLSVPTDVERVDVKEAAARDGVSIEHAAHTARHDFFRRARVRLDASVVAVAHTKDDQAETFLLRLLRGAGPRGLSGMHPRSGIVVRPFLETRRASVRAFLDDRGVQFREDASNQDAAIPRNRIRHELLPQLDSRFAPNIVDILDREAMIAREDAEYLDDVARAASEQIISRTPGGVELDEAALLRQPPAIARRVIRLAQLTASGDDFAGFDAVEAVLRYAVSKSTGPLDLPGHRVNRRGAALVLTRRHGRDPRLPAADFTYLLEVPGRVAVPEANCAISATVSEWPERRAGSDPWRDASGQEAVVAAGGLAAPLAVRNRRPGDRFRPLGLNGRKKLQDFFVDAKIGRAEREITPVIVDSSGRIVWVAGHALAEEFRVTDTTKDVVILKRVPI